MAEKLSNDQIIKALLDAAFFRSAGDTSLANVADNLGIKKASLYNHFESKQDMMNKATESCGEYINGINFIPNDVQGVAQRYPAETVLKGLVSRYVKMHEKDPLFQIYTFLESQKFFDSNAARLIEERNRRLVEQTETVLIALFEHNKISIQKFQIHGAAVWFCAGMNDLLSSYLLARKEVVKQNPPSGEGELFTLETDEESIERINKFVEEFAVLLKHFQAAN